MADPHRAASPVIPGIRPSASNHSARLSDIPVFTGDGGPVRVAPLFVRLRLHIHLNPYADEEESLAYAEEPE